MKEGANAPRRQRLDYAIACSVGLASFLVLAATSRDYAMVWDEGFTVRRVRVLAPWFEWVLFGDPQRARSEAFTWVALETHWPFAREEPDGHPPFYALVCLAGWVLAERFVDPLTAYRIGPMLLTGATLGVLSLHLSRRFGPAAGCLAPALVLLTPRTFSHAHYSHYDMPTTCFWLLTQVTFVNALERRRHALLFGIAYGLACACKFTGLFALVPPLLYVLGAEIGPWVWQRLWRTRKATAPRLGNGTRAVLIGLPVALATLYAVQPPWWVAPRHGPIRFLESNLTRSETKPIPTYFLGTVYAFSLPWYNTVVLTVATVPMSILVMATAGLVYACSRGRRSAGEPSSAANSAPAPVAGQAPPHFPPEPAWPSTAQRTSMLLWFLSWLTLMVVRALPQAPGHDGIRLILPSIVSLSILAGIAAGWWFETMRSLPSKATAGLVALFPVTECVVGIAETYPYTLSYYSYAIGGLKGAEKLGLEITYYWDTLGTEFFEEIQRRQTTERVELRFPVPLLNVQYLREWRRLPRSVRVVDYEPTEAPYYVLQRRRGTYYPYDWWLEEHGQPAFRIQRQGVDLLRLFPYSESLKAYEATRHEPTPEHLPELSASSK